MSLDQLVGTTIHLVVYIAKGSGFDFLTSPIMVTTSVLGHVLATDVEPACPEPYFNYELTYEINKKCVKRLRVNNTSLKVDCYTLHGSREDRIGYVLLNFKQLQIEPEGGQIKEAWHRVLGLSKDAAVLKPQLLLSFYVTDIPKDDPAYIEALLKPLTWKKSQHIQSLPVYIKEDEGIIQIGPDKLCTNHFTLTLSFVASDNITQLIDKNVEAGLSVVCSILGYTVRTKPFPPVNNTYLPDEKIVINLRSALKYLNEITEPLKVDLVLMCGDHEIGTTSFLLEDLTKNLKRVIEKRCVVVSPKLDASTTADLQPWLEVAVCFAKDSKPAKKTVDIRMLVSHKPRDEGGKKSQSSEAQLPSVEQKRQTKSMPSVRLNLASLDKPCPETAPAGSTYRAQRNDGPLQNYILTVVLDRIQLTEVPGDGKISFRFHHPEAVIKTVSNTEVCINNTNESIDFPPVQGELSFKLPALIHQSCLIAEPPKVTVNCEGQELASTVLQPGILFSHDQKKCSYTGVLENEGQYRGFLGITMSLDDVEGQTQVQSLIIAPEEPTPCTVVADDQMMFKVVEELEDWKEKQQEIFKAVLMRKEREYMAKVCAEWEEKKRLLEETLVFNVENSNTVLDSLNMATEKLMLREFKLKEKQMKLQHEKEELESKYNAKMQELRIASQRMKEEQSLKTSAAIMENVDDLEKKVKMLEKERNELEKKVNIFEEDGIKYKEECLSKEHAETILKEMENLVARFEKEKQSKVFYKTEWGKAVREQRKLKKLYDDISKKNIKRNNDELRLLSIREIMSAHDNALQQDQLRLLGLKGEVLSWNKGQRESARSIGTDHTAGSIQTASQCEK